MGGLKEMSREGKDVKPGKYSGKERIRQAKKRKDRQKQRRREENTEQEKGNAV